MANTNATSTIDTSSNPLAAYGYDANTGQLLAQQLGMTPAQLAAAFTATPTSPGGGRDLQATISQLQIAKASGMGSSPGAATPGAAAATPASASGTSSSYLNQGNTAQGNSGMASSVTPQQAIQYYTSMGGNPNIDANTAMAYFSGQNPNFGASGVSAQDAINYYIQKGGNPQIDPTTAISFYEQQNPQAVQQGLLSPEQRANQQLAKTDPTSEALRTQLAGSYATPLSQAQTPTAAQYQSYLDTFKAVDPEEYAQRQGLATGMDSYLQQAQSQMALGSQLDPVTARQVEQQTRAAQAARGNVYGTPQMAEEAMTTGQAGLALQQQRMQNLQGALGQQQNYLGAGLGLGDTAMSLYQQGLGNLTNAQNSALNYLGSGQTPYQTGASYLDRANANAASAAQGGPVYQPAALGQSTQAAQIPQYGLDIGQQSQNWYNSLSAYSQAGTPTKNKGAAAATGALSGAASGAMAGTAAYPGIGTAIGAGVGALAGGASGYFS